MASAMTSGVGASARSATSGRATTGAVSGTAQTRAGATGTVAATVTGELALRDEPYPVTIVLSIAAVRADALTWGNLSGPCSVVEVTQKLAAGAVGGDASIDIRRTRFHEATSPALTLRATTTWPSGAFPNARLFFFGSYDQAVALAGRPLLMTAADGRSHRATVTTERADLSVPAQDRHAPRRWELTLDDPPGPFRLDDFDEEAPSVIVFGNLLEATQGKTEREAALGDGDGRQTFQTFKLPKAPLTYLNRPGATPPEAPELEIRVEGRRWERVASLFGRRGDEQVYVVREEADASWVQFGDGLTGSRLPSGIKNVVARWRTGTGAFGPLKPETTVQAVGRLDRLDTLYLPGIVTGGTEPERGENAREAAPGMVQSLDRLVSLRDWEVEAHAIAGVDRAVAAWELVDGVPGVVLTVLMATGRAAELEEVRRILTLANRCRGPRRYPVVVRAGRRSYVYLRIELALDPGPRVEPILAAVREALGVGVATGLFGARRRFGEREYAGRIEGTVQNVSGVIWARTTTLAALGPADDPASLSPPPPSAPRLVTVPCDPAHVLALDGAHLTLTIAAVDVAREC
jgi:hypothetical protein